MATRELRVYEDLKFSDLMKKKNAAVIDFDVECRVASRNGQQPGKPLALLAAELEDEVVFRFIAAGQEESAVINLVSAGSLYARAGKGELARERLARAKSLTTNPDTASWIQDEIDSLNEK